MKYSSSFLLSIIIWEHMIDLEKIKEGENDKDWGDGERVMKRHTKG